MPSKKPAARKAPKQQDRLMPVVHHAIGGAVFGLIAGLVLGLAIQAISWFLLPVDMSEGPHIIAPFLGMGFGSMLGAIFGGMAGLKE